MVQVVAERLEERGLAMPLHWRLVSDNASAESKNNVLVKFMAVQVAQNRVNSVTMSQGRVGHTHNRQDASFGQVAVCLNRAKVLEDPDGFCQQILQQLPGYHVELVHAAEDFKQWLHPLGVRMTGINQPAAASKQNLEAIHSWKMLRRELLPKAWQEQVETPDWLKAFAPHGRDVILLPKLYMASPKLSQPPIMFLPYEQVSKLPPRPQSPCIPRVPFSNRQASEFLKTAETMRQWGHLRAYQYLKTLDSWFAIIVVADLQNTVHSPTETHLLSFNN